MQRNAITPSTDLGFPFIHVLGPIVGYFACEIRAISEISLWVRSDKSLRNACSKCCEIGVSQRFHLQHREQGINWVFKKPPKMLYVKRLERNLKLRIFNFASIVSWYTSMSSKSRLTFVSSEVIAFDEELSWFTEFNRKFNLK